MSPQGIKRRPEQGESVGIGNVGTATSIYSAWSKRALAYLVDLSLSIPFLLLGLIFLTQGTDGGITAGYLFVAILLVSYGTILSFYNRCIMMGITGQSWGKRALGIRLVSETTGEPIGVGNAITREMAHAVDFIGLGYLLPMLDRKRQTVADKITRSIVIDVPHRVMFRKLDGVAQ